MFSTLGAIVSMFNVHIIVPQVVNQYSFTFLGYFYIPRFVSVRKKELHLEWTLVY